MNNTFNNIIDDITGLNIGGLCSHSLKIYDLTESPTNFLKCIHKFCISQKQNFYNLHICSNTCFVDYTTLSIAEDQGTGFCTCIFLLDWEGHSVFKLFVIEI